MGLWLEDLARESYEGNGWGSERQKCFNLHKGCLYTGEHKWLTWGTLSRGRRVVVVLNWRFLYGPIRKPSCLYSRKLLRCILNKLFFKARKGIPWCYYTTQSSFPSISKKALWVTPMKPHFSSLLRLHIKKLLQNN